MANEIDDIVKRTYRYYYEDGLVEMAIGLLFIACGLVLFAWQGIGSSPLMTVLLVVGLPAVVIGGAFVVKRLVRDLKQRVTYPRTGYVAYRRGEPSKGRWLLPAAALALVIASLFLPETFSRMQIMVGALLVIILGLMGYRLGLRRFYALGVAALLIGAASAVLLADEALGTALTFAGTGLLLFLSGGLVFLSYLRRNRARNDAHDPAVDGGSYE
jgi:hypothetical protein